MNNYEHTAQTYTFFKVQINNLEWSKNMEE